MFFGNTTVSSSYNGLGIRNDSVNPRQKPTRSFRVSKDNFIMRQARPFYRSSVGSPTVSANRVQKMFALFCCRPVAESFQEILNGAGRSIVNHLHMCKTRPLLALAVSIKRYRAQHRCLTFTPSACFMTFWSEKRVIHFYQASKTVSSIPICHRLTNLMGHQPCRLVICDLQDTLHLGYRHPHFVHRHVVDEPIPFDQGRAGFMEYRPSRQANFCTTRLAIQNISRTDKPCRTMSTSGTPESSRPPNFSQMLDARFFIRKFFLKIKQAALFVPFGHLCTPGNWRVRSLYELSQ
jgi:hypothetical protein